MKQQTVRSHKLFDEREKMQELSSIYTDIFVCVEFYSMVNWKVGEGAEKNTLKLRYVLRDLAVEEEALLWDPAYLANILLFCSNILSG